MKVGRQILMPLYLRPDQKDALAALAKKLDQPQQVLLREALDAYLARQAKRKPARTPK